MKYISAEEFLKQPKEVQKVLLDWWKPSNGDIFAFLGDDTSRKIGVLGDGEDIKVTTRGKGEYRLPLLTEGQLREFIHDKAGQIVEISLYCGGYSIVTKYRECVCEDLGDDLLQAYWKVACSVAKEKVQHEV